LRIAILTINLKDSPLITSIAKELSMGLAQNGHIIDCFDSLKDTNRTLTAYDFIFIGSDFSSLFAKKAPDFIINELKNSGHLSGKRSCAFTSKKLMGTDNSLKLIMQAMEVQGLLVTDFVAFSNSIEAKNYGVELKLERK